MAHVCAVVSSLVNNCLETISNNVSYHEESFDSLPGHLKDRLVKKLSLRGLLKDYHLEKLLHVRIRSLNLSSCDISDKGLDYISVCKALGKLDLNAENQPKNTITSAGVTKLASSCVNLHTVFLRRCINLGDDAVVALATHCPNLRNLNVGGCYHLTDVSLSALADHCYHLESLNISHSQTTDAGFIALANGVCQHSLKEVHLSYCVDVSDMSVAALVGKCQHLNILIFHGCPKVTEMSRDALEVMQQRGSKQLSWTIY